jgi:hypothetical protein
MTKAGSPVSAALSTRSPFTTESTNRGIDVPSGTIVDSTAMLLRLLGPSLVTRRREPAWLAADPNTGQGHEGARLAAVSRTLPRANRGQGW